MPSSGACRAAGGCRLFPPRAALEHGRVRLAASSATNPRPKDQRRRRRYCALRARRGAPACRQSPESGRTALSAPPRRGHRRLCRRLRNPCRCHAARLPRSNLARLRRGGKMCGDRAYAPRPVRAARGLAPPPNCGRRGKTSPSRIAAPKRRGSPASLPAKVRHQRSRRLRGRQGPRFADKSRAPEPGRPWCSARSCARCRAHQGGRRRVLPPGALPRSRTPGREEKSRRAPRAVQFVSYLVCLHCAASL